MKTLLLLNLLTACFGFVAGVHFCKGSVLLTDSNIVEISIPRCGYNTNQVDAIVSQATQYLVGALLLCVSFLLQVWANLIPVTNQIALVPALKPIAEYPLFLTIVGALLILVASYFLEKNLYKKRRALVQQKLEERVQSFAVKYS